MPRVKNFRQSNLAHSNSHSARTLLLMVFALTAALPAAAQAPHYNIIDLGTLPGASPTAISTAHSINRAGHVTGSALSAGGASFHGYLYRNGVMEDLLPSFNTGHSSGWSVNDNDEVAVQIQVFVPSIGTFFSHCRIWQNGQFKVLNAATGSQIIPAPGEIVDCNHINNAGDVVGASFKFGHGSDGWVYHNGTYLTLGSYGGLGGAARDINERGDIVGAVCGVGAIFFPDCPATIWPAFGQLGPTRIAGTDHDYGEAKAVNEAGDVVVGSFQSGHGGYVYAFLYSGGALQVIGGPYSAAMDRNESGQIIGAYSSSIFQTDYGVTWIGGVQYPLLDTVRSDCEWTLLLPESINDEGKIVGQGVHRVNGILVRRAFLMTPMTHAPRSFEEGCQALPSNAAPTADAGPDQIVEATSSSSTTVYLDGSASSDPDHDALTFTWTGPFGTATGATPAVSLALGVHTITLTVDDGNGHTATDTVQITVRDTSPPLIRCGTADGLWHASEFAIACTAEDDASALQNPADASFTLSTHVAAGQETADAETDSRTVCDMLGNCATAGPIGGNKVDKKAPVVSCGAGDGLWHASDVSIACTATEGGSGFADIGDAAFSLSTNVAANTETANAATNSRAVCDNAGNCATAGPVAGNKVDRKGPAIVVNAPSGSYLLGQAAAANFSCSDGGSGLATRTGTVASGSNFDTGSVGTKSFTVNATDAVGNPATGTVNYQVAYNLCLLEDLSKAKKSGSTFPIKVQVCDADGANRSSSQIVLTATQVLRLSDQAPAPLEDSGQANPDFNFRYDATLGGTGGYIFNLSSAGYPTGTFRLFFNASGDPVAHWLDFQVK